MVVQEFVSAIGEARFDDARRLLHDDFVIHAAGDVPYRGDYLGPDGFFDLIAQMFTVLELTPSPDMRYIADHDTVALHYRLNFTARASGATAEMAVTEVVTVREGLITELDVFYKNPSAVTALLAE